MNNHLTDTSPLIPCQRSLVVLATGLPGMLLLLLCLWWLALPNRAQAVYNLSFSGPFALPDSSDDTLSITVADLDGDGDLDIIAGNGLTQADQIWLNDGAGGFAAPMGLPDSSDPTQSIAVADLDGDGDLDIIAGNSFNQANQVWFNDGVGAFSSPIELPASSGHTTSIAVADLDGDGDLDITAENITGQANQVWFNNGVGGFTTLMELPDSSNTTGDIAVGDLDGQDGLDIIGGGKLWFNDGIGGFAPPTLLPEGGATRSVVVADLDGDGDLDIIAGNDTWQGNKVWLNGGMGSFAAPMELPDSSGDTTSIAVADLDGDGDLDIIAGNYFGQANKVWLNDGMGSFAAPMELPDSSGDTTSIAVADLDGDGDLDIIAGNDTEQGNKVWFNDGAGGFATPIGLPNSSDDTFSIAVADLDGDGDLDIIAGNSGAANKVWFNDGAGGFATPIGLPNSSGDTLSIAVADLDGDRDLDIIAGNGGAANKVWLNDGVGSFAAPIELPDSSSNTLSIAVADLDGDRDLDIIAGNVFGQADQTWFNDGGGSFAAPTELPDSSDGTFSIAISDLDGDGDLDIIAGNGFGPGSKVWFNDGTGSFAAPILLPDSSDDTRSIATADLDGDGDLDIIAGNGYDQASQVWFNNGTGSFASPILLPDSSDSTQSIAAADLDGDSDLDIIAGNSNGPASKVWLNDGAGSFAAPIELPDSYYARSIAVADLDRDGALDIVAGINFTQADKVWLSTLHTYSGLPNHPPFINSVRPVTTANANFFSSPEVLTGRYITIPYTLFDLEKESVGQVAAFYSMDGGDNWQPAVATSTTITTHLAASSTGMPHTYIWDTAVSGVYGRSNNIVLRFVAYPQPPTEDISRSYHYTNNVAGFYQWPYASSTTFPFSVQGTQVRVLMSRTPTSSVPLANALAYLLPAGHSTGAVQLRDQDTPHLHPYTDILGYFPGRPPLLLGDKLAALYPITNTTGITFTDKISLYHTSALVTLSGLDLQPVIEPGLQVLTITAENKLILFNLDLSLEWDARNDPFYLTKLEEDLSRASQLLFDWSNGQMALGRVHIYQAKENWYFSDIVVHASNQYRPNATIGGIVTGTLGEILTPTIVVTDSYQPGQIHMGASWNRYGEPGGSSVDDWAEALAHELGHYALFLQDNYFGVDENGRFTGVDCLGSAMSNPYQSNYSEFLSTSGWVGDCQNTLAQHTTGLPDWAMILRHFPMLSSNGGESFTGPNNLPLAVLNVQYMEPQTSQESLADMTVELVDENDIEITNFSSQAQGYLFKVNGTLGDITDDTAMLLGTPTVGGLHVRGLTPGDRLCLLEFTPFITRLGCADGADETTQFLTIATVENWQPQVQINSQVFTVTTTTLHTYIQITATLDITSAQTISPGLLMAQVLPAASLIPTGTVYAPVLTMMVYQTSTQMVTFTQQITIDAPIYNGFVRLWLTNATPAKEFLTEFRLGGDWPVPRASGGGIVPRASGGGLAPILSSDGQAIILSTDAVTLFANEFKASLQTLQVFPNLPPWLTPVGNGYRFTLASTETMSASYSIVIQYLQANVADAYEPHLNIYYQPLGSTEWQHLLGFRDTIDNLVSTNIPDNVVQGQGIYVLVAAIFAPPLEVSWNEFVFPLPGVQPINHALASIAHATTSVYGYDLQTFSWHLYDQTVLANYPEFSSLVNDLTSLHFGQSYWIYATEPVTPIIPIRGPQGMSQVSDTGEFLPATFYGWITPTSGFTPTVGMSVTATINDHLCGEGVVTDTVGTNQLAYKVQVLANTGSGCGVEGDTIRFAVGGQVIDEDQAWTNSQAWFHSLTNLADTSAPILAIPADITAEATAPDGAIVTFTVTAVDNRDPNPIIVCIPASGSIFPLDMTTVGCNATDASGNSAFASFTVTVVDTTPPVLAVPEGIIGEATSQEGAIVTYIVTATDTVDLDPAVVCTPASGSLFSIGETTVTCTAFDGSMNSVEGSFTVIVILAGYQLYLPVIIKPQLNTQIGNSEIEYWQQPIVGTVCEQGFGVAEGQELFSDVDQFRPFLELSRSTLLGRKADLLPLNFLYCDVN